MTTYDRHQIIRAELCAELQRSSIRAMAEQRGISYDAMRARLSYYGACCVSMRYEERRSLLRKLWLRGEPRTIAEYMATTPHAVRVMARRMGLGNGQLAMAL